MPESSLSAGGIGPSPGSPSIHSGRLAVASASPEKSSCGCATKASPVASGFVRGCAVATSATQITSIRASTAVKKAILNIPVMAITSKRAGRKGQGERYVYSFNMPEPQKVQASTHKCWTLPPILAISPVTPDGEGAGPCRAQPVCPTCTRLPLYLKKSR